MAEETRGRAATKTSSGRARSRSRSRKRDGKKGGFSIKRLLGGRSKKNIKKTDSDAASTTLSVHPADDKSVNSANGSRSAPPKPSLPTLQLVLLLMDPKTRRFELLQLEFDSDKARVSDILAQIPISVTEPLLENKNMTVSLNPLPRKWMRLSA